MQVYRDQQPDCSSLFITLRLNLKFLILFGCISAFWAFKEIQENINIHSFSSATRHGSIYGFKVCELSLVLLHEVVGDLFCLLRKQLNENFIRFPNIVDAEFSFVPDVNLRVELFSLKLWALRPCAIMKVCLRNTERSQPSYVIDWY